ncbi:hypothetical protein HDU88_004032 [Geranomyces variabilis]|nr:hypothetical protein HDU88_004032 [Geranomyces variabilis]
MELAHHLRNGENLNAKIGVARSDFAITSFEAKNVSRAGAAFLIAEFAAGADAHPIHKDTFVATAEAVFESHRIVANLDIDSVPLGRVHILLGSDRKLKFGVVQPIYLPGRIFRERQMEGLTFDLSKTLPFADRLENAERYAYCARFRRLCPSSSCFLPFFAAFFGKPRKLRDYHLGSTFFGHPDLPSPAAGCALLRPDTGAAAMRRVRVNLDDEGTGTTEAHDSKGEYSADSNCIILIQPLDSHGNPATQITFGFPSTAAFIVLPTATARWRYRNPIWKAPTRTTHSARYSQAAGDATGFGANGSGRSRPPNCPFP